MSNMRLFLELGVRGQGAVKSSLNDLATSTTQSTRKMAAGWASVERRMSNVSSSLTRIAALVGGGALLRQAVVDVMNFERGLMEMRLTGELTADAMERIREEIIALSSQTLQLPEDQLEAFKDMVAAGIDPKQALAGLKAIDRTATATFANVGDIGKTSVDLLQKMGIKPEKLERSFNILHKAGKAGRFELKDMARYFPEVLASASNYGVTGEKGVAQVAAMLQIARRNRAEPSEAATDMKQFFGHLVSYRKEFKKVGLNVFDFIDLKTGKFKAGKDIDNFFETLRKKTKGGSAAMLKAMGIQDTESTNFMAGIMKDWEDYKKIRNDALGAANQDIIGQDFDKVKTTTWAKAKSLEIERSKAMKSVGSSWLAEKTMKAGNWALEHPVAAGGAAAGTYVGWKLLQRFLSGGNGRMGIPGTGVPVTVTNFPSGFGGGKITPPNVGDRLGNKLPVPSTAGRVLGPVAAGVPVVGTAAVAYGSIKLGQYLAESEARSLATKQLLEIRSRQMVMGGGPKSYQVKVIDKELAARGIDTNGRPLWRTQESSGSGDREALQRRLSLFAQGLLVGGPLNQRQDSPEAIPDIAGINKAAAAQNAGSRGGSPNIRNDISLKVSIDRQGRVFSSSDDMNTNVRTDLKRGDFFQPLTDY